jgi:hypothetical protein
MADTWMTTTLTPFGMMSAAPAVGSMIALGWTLWHDWPRLGPRSPRAPARPAEQDGQPTVRASTTVPNDEEKL